MVRVSRRSLLATGEAAGMGALSGCLSGVSAQISEESDCFESVNWDQGFPLTGGTLKATLSGDCDTDYVVAVEDGEEIGRKSVGSGQSEIVMDIAQPGGYLALVAVNGGTNIGGAKVGGEIIESIGVEVGN